MKPTPPTHDEVLVLAAQIKPTLYRLRAYPSARQAIDVAEAVASFGWSPHGDLIQRDALQSLPDEVTQALEDDIWACFQLELPLGYDLQQQLLQRIALQVRKAVDSRWARNLG